LNSSHFLRQISERACNLCHTGAERDHRLPLTLIIFDTIIAAAQFAKAGDENDAAIGAQLMAALGEISRATGTFVLGIDHFGKAVETGTRGTRQKRRRPTLCSLYWPTSHYPVR
jgi:hypothetical protein